MAKMCELRLDSSARSSRVRVQTVYLQLENHMLCKIKYAVDDSSRLLLNFWR